MAPEKYPNLSAESVQHIVTQTRDNQMILSAFMQASNCSNYAASWRHPDTDPGFLGFDYYQHIARVLEEGKFHLSFLDDRLAMPSRYADSTDDTVRHGIRTVKLDPVPIITAMALATRNLGVGATSSTTYNAPYHLARLFATMDHMTKGRVAWNVVTSLNDSEAQNFGVDHHMEHDVRYDRADETMEIVKGLWDTWGEGALIQDKDNGLFADPDKVRRLDYQGQWLKSRGPLTVPRTPQGHPVIIQAGQSGRGREFAARWGEMIFVIAPAPEICRAFKIDIKERATVLERDPNNIKVTPAIYTIVGETEAEAQEKQALIEELVQPVDSLALLSDLFNYDFAQHAQDEPLSDDVLDAFSGARGLLDIVVKLSGKKNPSVNDFLECSGRGTIHELPVFSGTPRRVADQMEEWFTNETCDGFVIAATHMPGAYEDFVRMVVPELQRRGLFHTDYSGANLRENLGLPYPAAPTI